VEHALLTGLGLAAPAGLNAYLPLLVLALAGRLSTSLTLQRPYDLLSSNWSLGILVLLLTVEIVVDKIPGLDHANDLLQSVVRPAAGAILAMAAATAAGPGLAGTGGLNPVLAMLLGLVTAGAVHAAKAATRPAITLGTGGIGNPLVSIAEDTVAALTALVALVAPLLVLLFLLGFLLFVVWAVRRFRRHGGSPLRVPGFTSTTLRR